MLKFVMIPRAMDWYQHAWYLWKKTTELVSPATLPLASFSRSFTEVFLFSILITYVITTGGLLGVGFVGCPDLLNPPVDNDHCYACDDRLKHPKDGTLFKGGHVAATGFYASY